ncbi:hypothetical protein Q6A51_05660 [Pseudomonas sp. KFB-139]|uniref:Uncharacterized protein n=1 Tax=Pseudomonas serbiensis TaxID=3064350 RepID=A0ABT9CR62_9PSED|nr:hypothetical protein [Pseudomonas sp. KFB-138]MDO7926257.1 hypothetical protein [Pseudomonas sp. KFB-138]
MKKLQFELSRPYKIQDGELKTVEFRLNDVPAPFTKGTIFGNGFFLITWLDEESFGGDVLYIEDSVAYVRQFVRSTPGIAEITGGSRLARIKAEHWEDQSEFRFRLMAIRGPELIYEDNPDEYENELLKLMEKWHSLGAGAPPPELPFIDPSIDTLMFYRMAVTLG